MPTDGLADFADIAEEYYPGSTRKIPVRHPNRPEDRTQHRTDAVSGWDNKPKIYNVGGQPTEFFTVGHLADALGRKPGTLRKWEREGVIPKATFRAPSADPRGVRRLYSRKQVEGIVKIANDEGVLVSHQKPIKDTAFTARVIALFTALSAEKAAP